MNLHSTVDYFYESTVKFNVMYQTPKGCIKGRIKALSIFSSKVFLATFEL